MTIFDSINRSQSIVQHISSINSDAETRNLLIALSKELTTLRSSAEQLQQNKAGNQSTSITIPPSVKSGCYLFAGDKNYYCPQCYDRQQTKVPTTRINSKLRVCPACRSSIR